MTLDVRLHYFECWNELDVMMKKHVLLFLLLTVFLGTGQVWSRRPKIIGQIRTEVKRVGDTGYLNCTVRWLQNYQVLWNRDNPKSILISVNTAIEAENEEEHGKVKYEVIRRSSGYDRTTYTLVINRLTVSDAGVYSCTISVHVSATKSGNLTVQVPPEIILSQTSNNQEKILGEDMSLRCNATGSPTPNITWIRTDGKALPGGGLSYKGHVFNVTNMRKDYGGTYRCVADNSVIPPAQYDILVIVKFKPEAIAVRNTVGQAPNRGFHALLECKIAGMPQPILRWYVKTDNGIQILTDDNKYDINQLMNHGTTLQLNEVWYTLKIRNVQANDYNTYYCEGTNNLGTASAAVRLYETTECQGPDCPSITSTTTPQGSRQVTGAGFLVSPSVSTLLLMLLLKKIV